MPRTSMLDRLARAEAELPRLLAEGWDWHGLYIDYEHPFVERLWRPYGEGRLMIHRILPSPDGTALFHPHPWPSAMRIVAGSYEMGIGWSATDAAPPVAARAILPPGTVYEMSEPDGWHWVRPLDTPALTVMLAGAPWGRPSPKSPRALRGLTDREADALLSAFRERYPSR